MPLLCDGLSSVDEGAGAPQRSLPGEEKGNQPIAYEVWFVRLMDTKPLEDQSVS